MSGGVAYVWDQFGDFETKLNAELVDLDPIEAEDKALLLDMLTKHIELTGSTVAELFLSNFESNLNQMRKVMPRDYKAVLQQRQAAAQNKETLEAING